MTNSNPEIINSLIFNGANPQADQEQLAKLNELFQLLDPVVAQELANPNIYAWANPELITRLLNLGSKWPWFNHLVLAAMIYAATGAVNQATPVIAVHSFLKWAIPDFYPDLAHLVLEEALKNYFGPKLLPRGTDAYKRYSVLQRNVRAYLVSLPEARQAALAPFLLPDFFPSKELVALKNAAEEKTRRKQKKQIFPVIKHLPGLIALARRRCRWLQHLEAEIQKIAAQVAAGQVTLPTILELNHWDGQEMISFKIWNQSVWIQVHAAHYDQVIVSRARRRPDTFEPQLFLQLLSDLPADSWFLPAISLGIINGSADLSAEAQAYLERWSLPKFYALEPDLLQLSHRAGGFLSMIRQKQIETDEKHPLFCVEPLLAGALVGLFTLVSITTTGMRIGELQQVALNSECMVRSHLPEHDDEQDCWQLGPERIFWNVFPKGETQRRPYLVSATMLETMFALHDLHERYYGTDSFGPVSACRGFSSFSHRRQYPGLHAFVLQWKGRHLSSRCIRLCLSFLLLEHNLRDHSGQPVRITPHTLRHSIAGWLRLQGLPLQDIMTFLGHINMKVTDYYSELPADDLFRELGPALTALAQLAGIDPVTIRTVEQIRDLQVQALKQYGTLRQTVGGDCGTLQPCEVQFQCAACPHFVPDPARRTEIEQRISYLTTAMTFFQNTGQHLTAETTLEQCHHWRRVLAEVDAWASAPLLPPASVTSRWQQLDFVKVSPFPGTVIEPLAAPVKRD